MVFLFMMSIGRNFEGPKKGHFDEKRAGASGWKSYSHTGCIFPSAPHHNWDNWSESFGKNISMSLKVPHKPKNCLLGQIDRK